MICVVGASLGLIVGGPVGALCGGLAPVIWGRLRSVRAKAPTPVTLVLLLLLVELRSGQSVLAALIAVSEALPGHASLRTVARVAIVSGLVSSLPFADEELRPVVSQLARAQRSGSSLGGSVRHMLDNRIAAERALRIARARSLPARLMIPITLLMLPGLVLLLYAPSLLATFQDLTGALT